MSQSRLTPEQLEGLAACTGFARGVLGISPYPWADRIFSDLDRRGTAVALRAANGSGKTTQIAAPVALWHASVFPRSLAVCTAGVFRQVKEQLFPAIHAHAHKFPGWEFFDCEVRAHNGSRIIGFSTDNPGMAEGWHAENLLVIVDEAKSVPNGIFEALDRCQPTRLLLLSSPGGCTGAFYEAFHSRRKFFSCHTVTAYECPHIPAKWVQEQIEKYGEGHPLIASMIFAEFMRSGDDGTVIPLTFVERCLANPPEFKDGTVQAFADFAAGGDENVLAVRRGNRVQIVSAWRERDTMKAVGRFIQLFEQEKLSPKLIYGDAGGLGIVMCDALKEAGWPILRVNNGSPAQADHYANLGAEVWYEGRNAIERREIILPNDKELIGQLSSRLGWPDSKGRMQLESKQDMRNRGLSSPDKADAVLGAIAALPKPFRIICI